MARLRDWLTGYRTETALAVYKFANRLTEINI